MTPSEQGRFCDKCSKVVLDFTEMSNSEIIAYLESKKEKVCGKFRKEQIITPLTLNDKLKKFLYVLALVFFPFTTISQTSESDRNNNELKTVNKTAKALPDTVTSKNEIIRQVPIMGGCSVREPIGGCNEDATYEILPSEHKKDYFKNVEDSPIFNAPYSPLEMIRRQFNLDE